MAFTRRQALALGFVGAPLATLASLALAHRLDVDTLLTAHERTHLGALTAREFATLKCALRRLCDASTAALPSPDVVGAAGFIADYLVGAHPADRDDVKGLLGVVEHVVPLSIGATGAFSELAAPEQDGCLRAMERSAVPLLRVGFNALKQLAAMGYFRDPRTFEAIGYNGPMVPAAAERGERPVRGVPLPFTRATAFDVDVVVVGAGAGGSMAARELARAGARVLLLEEGPDHPPESFTQREDEMIPALYQDRGGRATSDRAIMVLQGRGLGGSTIHNQNLCKRTPDVILDHWRAAYGLTGWSARDMSPIFEEVERDLSISRIDDLSVNENNRVLARGAAALRWQTARLHHNRTGCVGSGFCELGCAYDGKNNARKTVIPAAVAAGALVRPSTRVTRVLTGPAPGASGRRVRAVGLLARDTVTGAAVTVRARAVVLAASAVGSAALAIASGLPDPWETQGAGLHLHPGGVVAGVFRDGVGGWRGVPQSVECVEWLDPTPGSDRRVWIVPGFAHPVGTASMTPGFGRGWTDSMREYPRTAALISMLHDDSEGRVRSHNGRPRIDYVLGTSDREQMARGLRACAEILLAAGAERVMVPFVTPLVARRASDLRVITAASVGPHALPLTAVHPMSAMRAGADARRSVCDPTGEHHHVRGLFVADGGLFPTSLGTPPQESIYAAGMKVGREVARWLSRT